MFSDSLFPNLIEALSSHLEGQPYTKLGVSRAVSLTRDVLPSFSSELLEFENWLRDQVEV